MQILGPQRGLGRGRTENHREDLPLIWEGVNLCHLPGGRRRSDVRASAGGRITAESRSSRGMRALGHSSPVDKEDSEEVHSPELPACSAALCAQLSCRAPHFQLAGAFL